MRRLEERSGAPEAEYAPMVNSDRDIFFFLGLALTASFRLGKLCDSAGVAAPPDAAAAAAASRSSASARSASAAQAPILPHFLDIFKMKRSDAGLRN